MGNLQGRNHSYSGIVRKVMPYGAFVRFGDRAYTVAKDGLLRTNGLQLQLCAGDELRVWVKSVKARSLWACADVCVFGELERTECVRVYGWVWVICNHAICIKYIYMNF